MSDNQNSSREQGMEKHFFRASAEDFGKIPGNPIAYWVSKRSFDIFGENSEIGDFADARVGLQTSDNDRFLRAWQEVSFWNIAFDLPSNADAARSEKKWFPCNKGGEFRKWFGNHFFVVNWSSNGEEIRNFRNNDGKLLSRPQNIECYFKEAVSWSDVTSSANAFRFFPKGFINDATGHSAFGGDLEWKFGLVAYCNNKYVNRMARILNPTMHFHIGYFNKLPYAIKAWDPTIIDNARRLVSESQIDWNSYETSWDFTSLPLLHPDHRQPTLKASYQKLRAHWREMTLEMQRLEQENNRIFIDAYGLQDELDEKVALSEITLTCNPHYRYGGNKSDEELEALLQADTLRELVSYAIGCMMGRYSLDEPGLVYAEAGNVGFQRLVDDGAYQSFAADGDGILPLTEDPWFEDDIAERLRAFIKQVWGETTLTENLEWLADNLGRSPGDTAMQGLRSYLARGFYKDHLKTYKRRPIYWLFSSGKHKAFECLVYLHRYHEGTLSRIRLDYVHPLLSKFDAHHQQLAREQAEATTTSEKNRLKKALAALEKKQVELADFDDRLKHYAERRIRLDLDDGVKVNYGKFGDLLAEVKAVTGGSSDD